jgi:pimeloyl-ACP methyl ester carboxylesterase
MSHGAMRIKVADEVALHVRTWGVLPARMLLIHGFGQGSFIWRSLAASMPELGLSAVDLRGHGDSDHDRSQRYSIDMHVADVVKVARSLDLHDYVLVGHSLGAAVSVLAMEQLPRPPRAVVLIDGGPGLSPSASSYIREEFLSQKLRYRSAAEYQEDMQTSMPLAAIPLLQAMAVDALEELGPQEFRLKADRGLGYQEQGDSIDVDLWDALQRIDIPLLLVRGAVSSLCSRRWSDDFVSRVPHATVETVERAGHAVMLDNPVRFNALIKQYVSQWLGHRGVPLFNTDRRAERCSGMP